jgi:hypothetical protein
MKISRAIDLAFLLDIEGAVDDRPDFGSAV